MGTRPVFEAVAELLRGLGVRRFFGLVGSGNFHLTNALVGRGARFIPARHEGGAITMADAWARVTGEVGVCTVHQGPGLTNTITGLTEAAKSQTPLLVLAAATARPAVRSNFRIDQARLVEAVGAAAECLYTPDSALDDALRAFHRAQVERRPVVLMMPLDVQAAPCPREVTFPRLPDLGPIRPASRAVAGAAEALGRSRPPLIIAGRGAVIARAREVLEAPADRVGALLATSAAANGLFSGNPWCLGIAGGFAAPVAGELIYQADVVAAFGASLNMWTTHHGRLINPAAAVIQVDHAPEAIGTHHRVDIAVVGDVSETARELLDRLDRREVSGPGWRTEVRAAIEAGTWRNVPYEDSSTADRIDPRTLSIALDEIFPPNGRLPPIRVTSWATRPCTCGCLMPRVLCLPRPSRRSASVWPRPSGRPSPGPTG